jgi:hypothetical protein
MNLNILVLNLKIVVLYISNFYECKKIYSNYKEEFINLAVISDYVYIGGKNNLIQLNSSLGIVSIKSIEGSNWLLTPYKTRDEETILISCDYEGGDATKCIGYRSNLSIVDGHTTGDIKIKNPQARYTTTSIGPENILTIASSDCLKHPKLSAQCYAISNYKEEIESFSDKGTYTVEYLDAKKNNRFIFDFRTVVGHDKYTYFLFVFNNTVSKLGKICKDANTFNSGHNAYEDVPIVCSHNGVNFTTAQDLMFWNDDLLVVFTDDTASVICKFTNLYDNFKISRIERLKCPIMQMANKYFYKPSFNVCYNEAIGKCQSSTEVSIVLRILLECRYK